MFLVSRKLKLSMAVVNYGKAITSNFMTSVNIQHKEKKYGTKYCKILQKCLFFPQIINLPTNHNCSFPNERTQGRRKVGGWEAGVLLVWGDFA